MIDSAPLAQFKPLAQGHSRPSWRLLAAEELITLIGAVSTLQALKRACLHTEPAREPSEFAFLVEG